jgi:hypothetical protein
MVRNVTDPTQQPVSNPSSYQYGPSDNIDERDAEDPLCVTSYVEDMYEHFRGKEAMTSVRPAFMEGQPHINERMRSILVDWLVEVHLKFKLVPETLYLTINLIDRYLERKEVSRPKLQLVGVTSLLIASKYEEIYPPELRDLVYICDRAYTRTEVRIRSGLLPSFYPSRQYLTFHLSPPFYSDHSNGGNHPEDFGVQHHHPERTCIPRSLLEGSPCGQENRAALVLYLGWYSAELQFASLSSQSISSSRRVHCPTNCWTQLLESNSFEIR